jgi:hypothetical protein
MHTFEAGFETKKLQGLKWLVLGLSVFCLVLVSVSGNYDFFLEADSFGHAHVRGVHGVLLLQSTLESRTHFLDLRSCRREKLFGLRCQCIKERGGSRVRLEGARLL